MFLLLPCSLNLEKVFNSEFQIQGFAEAAEALILELLSLIGCQVNGEKGTLAAPHDSILENFY